MNEEAMVVTLGFFLMVTVISVYGIHMGNRGSSKQPPDSNGGGDALNPLQQFRSFDDRIRKIEERIQNLEILMEEDDELT